MFTGWPFLLGKCGQTGCQNYPIPAHFAGLQSPLAAELKHSLLSQPENCRGFGRGANQVQCGLGHALQNSRAMGVCQ